MTPQKENRRPGTQATAESLPIGPICADYPASPADTKPTPESRLAEAVAFLRATPRRHSDRTVAAIKLRFGLTAKQACEALAMANGGSTHGS